MTEKLTRDDLAQEEFEDMDENQIDEISKKTLGSYIKKAKNSYALKGALYHDKVKKGDGDSYKDFHKLSKRANGIDKAVDRLAKEEFEDMDEDQIDEVTKSKNVEKHTAEQ